MAAGRDESVHDLLAAMRNGDEAAAERLLPIVYDELRRVAGAAMAGLARSSTRRT